MVMIENEPLCKKRTPACLKAEAEAVLLLEKHRIGFREAKKTRPTLFLPKVGHPLNMLESQIKYGLEPDAHRARRDRKLVIYEADTPLLAI